MTNDKTFKIDFCEYRKADMRKIRSPNKNYLDKIGVFVHTEIVERDIFCRDEINNPTESFVVSMNLVK